MKEYKYLIFDLDDTLIDNYENVKHAFKVTLKNMNIDYSDGKFLQWLDFEKKFWKIRERQGGELLVPDEFKEPLDKMVKWIRSQRFIQFFNCVDLENAMQLNEIYLKALNEMVVPIEGAYKVLKELSQQYNIIVGTNGPSVATESKLSKINCLQFVDKIYAADMFGVMKPHVRFFNEVKKGTSDCDSSKYLAIGDSLTSDVEGAINAGIDSCWFNIKKVKNDTKIKPTYEISQLKDLLKVLNLKTDVKSEIEISKINSKIKKQMKINEF